MIEILMNKSFQRFYVSKKYFKLELKDKNAEKKIKGLKKK